MKTLFHYFDNSKPGYGLNPVYWIDGPKVSGTLDYWFDGTWWRVHAKGEQHIPEDLPKFDEFWTATCQSLVTSAKSAPYGGPIYLDVEHIPHVRANDTWDFKYLNELNQQFRLQMPGIKLCFVMPDLPYNREDITSQKVSLNKNDFGPLDVDQFCLGVYLLGSATIARDLNYVRELRRIVRRAFPNVQITFAVWGRYHPMSNEEIIDPEILRQYVKAVTGLKDDVIVFDPQSPRDDYFIECLKLKSKPLLL